jgi:hypothetical protein
VRRAHALSAILLSSCSLVIPFSDYDSRPAPAPDAGEACGDLLRDAKNCGACGHDCLDVDCVDGLCTPTTIVERTTATFATAVTLDADRIWVSLGLDGAGAIWRIPKNALSSSEIFTPGEVGRVSSVLAFDGDEVVWGNWLHGDPPVGSRIARARRDPPRGPVTTVDVAAAPLQVWSDPEGGTFWWDRTSSIYRLPRGATTPLRITTSGFPPVAFDERDFYWATTDGTVHAMPKRGGTEREVARGAAIGRGIVVDASDVYWIDARKPSGAILRVPKSGGAPVVVADDIRDAVHIVDGGEHLYLSLEPSSPSAVDGRVVRVPKRGGPALVLARSPAFYWLALDATHVYWTNIAGPLLRVAR